MFHLFTWIIFLVVLNVTLAKSTVKWIYKPGIGNIDYRMEGYEINCYPNCNYICKIEPCSVVSYLMLCNVNPSSDMQKIINLGEDLEQMISIVQKSKCGSFDDFALFKTLRSENSLQCGKLIRNFIANGSHSMHGFRENGTINQVNWPGNVLVLGILTVLNGSCVKSTLLWTYDFISLQSMSSTMNQTWTRLILQTIWKSSEDDIISKTGPEQIFLTNVKNVNGTGENTFTQMVVETHVSCQPFHYLIGCWYECKDMPSVYTCDKNTGAQQCLAGWFQSEVIYNSQEETKGSKIKSVTMMECNMVDSCHQSLCSDACISTGNGTHACIDNTLEYDPPGLYVAPGDIIRCFYQMDGNEVSNYIQISWRSAQSVVANTFSNFAIKKDKLYILHQAAPSYNYIFACSLSDNTNTIRIEEIRNYTVILYPTIIWLNVTLQHVFLGDYIKCYSNAWPDNYLEYSMDIPTKNFDVHANYMDYNVIYVPEDARLGQMNLNCSVGYRFSGNDSNTFYKVFRIYIYAMRQFRWNNARAAIYFNNDSASVTVSIKVPYKLSIVQLGGPSEAVIDSDSIRFNQYCKGAVYKFVAMLFIGNINGSHVTFFRFFKPVLFEPPTYAILRSFKGYPHEMIHCITDGYPKELIKITFLLLNISDDEIINTTQATITLPSGSPLNAVYRIECSYTMLVNNVIYSGKVEEQIIIITRRKPYEFQYGNYLEPLSFGFLSLYYFYFQLVLMIGVIYAVCNYLHGNPLLHIFQTFLYYNNHRRGVRYREKMTHYSDVLLMLHQEPTEKDNLKLATFHKFLKRKKRHSYTPGFAVVPKFPKVKEKPKYIKETKVEEPGLPIFYGIGPRAQLVKLR